MSAAGSASAQAAGSAVPVSMDLAGLDVSGSPGHRQLRFSVEPRVPGSASSGTAYIGEAVDRSLESFLLGLCLPDNAFWVNLTPDPGAQSIDPRIADTDTGKILLAADLLLKKDTSSLTNPRTSPAGRKYWELLYAKAAELGIEDIPISSRVWIVPGPVRISEQADSVRIEESGLDICLETERLYGRKKNALTPKQLELYDYSSRLMKELIVPALRQKVNEGASYDQLRQVYRAQVLARWYRERFLRNDPSMKAALPSGSNQFRSRLPYNFSTIYRQYMDSLRQGEYDISDSSSGRLCAYMELITRRYFSGGIDWRSIPTASASYLDRGPQTCAAGSLYFSITLDSRRQRPLQYARESIRVMHADARETQAGPGSLVEDGLPSVSPVDVTVATVLKQNLSLHRIISRNL
ncbi:MAG TPA: hypothetical protein PK562_02465 [Candidatus Omnitrophota bacterium]|nr:hypothetical protein [Candidatus Omnitrophota bacterium]